MIDRRGIEPGEDTRLPFASSRYRAPTKDEFTSVTRTLGLTGSMVGQLVGVTSLAVREWIGGKSDIPYSAWRLLLIHAGLALDDPERDRVNDDARNARARLRRDLSD